MAELAEADRVEALVLVDNQTDNLSTTPSYVENEMPRLWRKGLRLWSGQCMWRPPPCEKRGFSASPVPDQPAAIPCAWQARTASGTAAATRVYATTASAPRATSDSSLREGPCGCFSPSSHWLTRPVVTFR